MVNNCVDCNIQIYVPTNEVRCQNCQAIFLKIMRGDYDSFI